MGSPRSVWIRDERVAGGERHGMVPEAQLAVCRPDDQDEVRKMVYQRFGTVRHLFQKAVRDLSQN